MTKDQTRHCQHVNTRPSRTVTERVPAAGRVKRTFASERRCHVLLVFLFFFFPSNCFYRLTLDTTLPSRCNKTNIYAFQVRAILQLALFNGADAKLPPRGIRMFSYLTSFIFPFIRSCTLFNLHHRHLRGRLYLRYKSYRQRACI